MLAGGYPPDIWANPPTPANTYSPLLGSFWETHLNNYWDVTTCAFVHELDPLYGGPPFELLVDWVEQGLAPPAGQCIPRGGAMVADPVAAGRPAHCAELLVE